MKGGVVLKDVVLIPGLEQIIVSTKQLALEELWTLIPPTCKGFPHGIYIASQRTGELVMVGDHDCMVDMNNPLPKELQGIKIQLPKLPVEDTTGLNGRA